jgi:hypothetical protein
LFNSYKMEEWGGQYVDSIIGVPDVLGILWVTPTLFKVLTNFTSEKFDELASQVVFTIKSHAKSIGELHFSYFMFSILIFGA